ERAYRIAGRMQPDGTPTADAGRVADVMLALLPPTAAAFTTATTMLNLWLADRKSTRLNSSHVKISYAVFCLKKKKKKTINFEIRKPVAGRITRCHSIAELFDDLLNVASHTTFINGITNVVVEWSIVGHVCVS